MNKIATLLLLLSIGCCMAVTKLVDPYLQRSGTSVIAITEPGKRGGTYAVKLPASLSTSQHEILTFAYQTAKTDGLRYPQYLQGIIMQESRAGSVKEFRVSGLSNKVGDRYFGIAQIKLAAAKDVMKQYPEMWHGFDTRTDEELQARLVLDDRFNVRVASKYTLMMGINTNPSFAITAYNQGIGGALSIEDPKSFAYTVSVKQHSDKMKSVQPRSTGVRSMSASRS